MLVLRRRHIGLVKVRYVSVLALTFYGVISEKVKVKVKVMSIGITRIRERL